MLGLDILIVGVQTNGSVMITFIPIALMITLSISIVSFQCMCWESEEPNLPHYQFRGATGQSSGISLSRLEKACIVRFAREVEGLARFSEIWNQVVNIWIDCLNQYTEF